MNGAPSPPADPRIRVGRRRDQVLVTDLRGRIEGTGPAGWPAGTSLLELAHPDDRALLETAFGRLAADSGGQLQVECRFGEPGAWRHAQVTLANPTAPGLEGRLVVTVGVGAPVADSNGPAAPVDELTGLATRAAVLDRLQEPPGPACRDARLAVLYVDLDHFKAVNDRLGHRAGDALLVAAAERLRRAVRPDDVVARLGGDELVIIAEGVERAEDAVEIGRRAQAAVARPLVVGGRVITVTASVGVAVGPRRLGTSLLDEADVALYQAKREGRDRTLLYDPAMARPLDNRHDTEAVLRAALERDGLTMAYHPVVELATGQAWGIEAALLLRDRDGKVLDPESFLDAAEATGLIVSIGAGMLDAVCDQAVRGGEAMSGTVGGTAGGQPLAVWMALSARQLADRHTAARVAATLQRHGVPTDRVWLEVRAETLVRAAGGTERTLRELGELGVHLVVGDFGTGPSPLTCLDSYPIDAIMLDGALLEGFDEEPPRDQLLRAILRLTDELDLATVARGVTTSAEADRLAALGCRFALGPYFAAPATPPRGGQVVSASA